jgi:hypothetical protein
MESVKGVIVATLITSDKALAYILAPRIPISRILSSSTVSLSVGRETYKSCVLCGNPDVDIVIDLQGRAPLSQQWCL